MSEQGDTTRRGAATDAAQADLERGLFLADTTAASSSVHSADANGSATAHGDTGADSDGAAAGARTGMSAKAKGKQRATDDVGVDADEAGTKGLEEMGADERRRSASEGTGAYTTTRRMRRAWDTDGDVSKADISDAGATDIQHLSRPSLPPPPQRAVTVRFTDGSEDLNVTIGFEESVRAVKQKIRNLHRQLSQRRLRLIHSGRILSDGTLLASWLDQLEAKQRRQAERARRSAAGELMAAIEEMAGVEGEGEEEDRNGGDAREAAKKREKKDKPKVYLQCSVGDVMEEGEEAVEREQTTQLRPVRGFDRLRTAGFSEEDIEDIRRQFHNSSAAGEGRIGGTLDDEQDDEHARALEEQWIDDMSGEGAAEAGTSTEGMYVTVLQGLLTGFFFPLTPLFFFRDRTSAVDDDDDDDVEEDDMSNHRTGASVVFSKRMQVAVVMAMAANFVFGAFRSIW